jgi:hypothetical protein
MVVTVKQLNILVSSAILTILISCANPVMSSAPVQTNMSASGSLRINLAAQEADRSVVPLEYQESVARYEILLSGTQSMGPLVFEEDVILLEALPPGDYTVSVSALNSEGTTLAIGSVDDISVNGDEEANIDVTLLPVMGGQGTLLIEYSWPADDSSSETIDKVIASITPSGGVAVPVDVDLEGNMLRYEAEYPSGEYVFSCELFSKEDLLSVISETVCIFDGQETESRIEYGPEIFRTVPEAPDKLMAVQNGLSVDLFWRDNSDFETAYEVYRSENGGDFILIGKGIPGNTVCWTDSPLEPGKTYKYRIAAVNLFGASDQPECVITVNPLIVEIETSERGSRDITLGVSDNTIPISDLLHGFENNFNRSVLEVVSVKAGNGISAGISGGDIIIDVSEMPYELEGQNVSLEYTVHIAGEPLNDTFSTKAVLELRLAAPAVEKIAEEDLLDPVVGFIYDNRSDLERKMRVYDPPGPREIFENWGRVSNSDFFDNEKDAESPKNKNGDSASLALEWELNTEGDETYLEYPKNSVYAGFVCPDGEESEHFTLEATVSSEDDDNDTIGLIVAFLKEGDSTYILEAARSQGSSSGDTYIEPREGWGLIVRRLSPDAGNPEIGDVLWMKQLNVGGVNSRGWNSVRSRIRVVRDGNRVIVSTTDWNDENNYVPGSEISVDLRSVPELSRFTGPRKYGYFTASQEQTSFRNIFLDSGVIQDKLFYIDPETGASEVWWYDRSFKSWIPVAGADIQGVLGYPLEVTNPETGKTFLIERRGFRRGRWKDWRELWEKWNTRGNLKTVEPLRYHLSPEEMGTQP